MTESPSRASIQLKREGRPEGGTLMPCKDSQIQQEEEVLFLLARTQPIKSPGNFVYDTLPNLVSPSMTAFSFPCPAGTCMWLA